MSDLSSFEVRGEAPGAHERSALQSLVKRRKDAADDAREVFEKHERVK